MKKGVKISLIVVAILLAIGAAFFIYADVMLSRFATREVNKALAALPFDSASCGGIFVDVFSATASVDDIHFAYRGEPINPKDTTLRPASRIAIERIEIGHLFYAMLFSKQVLVHDIHIVQPRVELWLDDEHPERSFPEFPKDTTDTFVFPLRSAELMHLHVEHVSLALHSLRTPLDVAVDSLSLSVHDLAYDSAFHYCDSIYRLHIAHAKIITPDGLMRIETRDLNHLDQGPLTLAQTRIGNIVPKQHLGDITREPATWIDLFIDQVATSPFNPIRKALAADLTLDHVDAQVSRMDIFRDERYKPRSVCLMPQTIMRSIPIEFDIRSIDAAIKKIHIEFASTNTNVGQLDIHSIKANVSHATNRRGATLAAKGHCALGSGTASAAFHMTFDKNCTWGMRIQAETVNTSVMDHFVRPLVGMTSDCMIDRLDVQYTGNTVQADGTFRMLYHGFKVQVHKDDNIPYKIITKNAKAFNTLGNSLLAKSNPSAVNTKPRAYKITWKRNEYKPIPLYFFGPCIDGVKKTLLPGLYVHLKVKDVNE